MVMLRRKQQKRTIDPTIHVTCCPCVFIIFSGVSFAHRWMIGFSDKFPPLGARSTSDVTSSKILCVWFLSSSLGAISAINPSTSARGQAGPLLSHRLDPLFLNRLHWGPDECRWDAPTSPNKGAL